MHFKTLSVIIASLLLLGQSLGPPGVSALHGTTVMDHEYSQMFYRQVDWPPVIQHPTQIKTRARSEVALSKPLNRTDHQTLAEDSYRVYESYRDGNWEVYRTNGDGANVVRLTNNIADDRDPRLSPNGEHIIFISSRDGNDEIYSMNADGSGLRRLTSHPAIEAQPAWSPDGTHIVFVSDRDGNAEIYKMKVDGSEVVQLTNNQLINLYPVWSVFDSSIAWVIADPNSASRTLYVMNVDGSNQHFMQAQCSYMSHPHWSPDGRKIAYDCDMDFDGWNEVVIADVGRLLIGTGWQEDYLFNARIVYDPNKLQVDARFESWAPDGESLLMSDLLWQNTGTGYKLIDYSSYQLILDTNQVLRLDGQTDSDRSFDWRWRDSFAPVSKVSPLPEYTRVNTSLSNLVAWTGHDVGPAGILGYDLQYKLDNTAWTQWPIMPDGTLGNLGVEQAGETVHVQLRARDMAGNVEAWPSDPGDALTHIVQFVISGTVRDGRMIPLMGATALMRPAIQSSMPVTTGRDGHYVLYAITTTGNTAQFGKAGYTTSPDTDINTYSNAQLAYLDGTLHPYLYPQDNIIINSSFEDGLLTPTGWNWYAQTGPFVLTLPFMGKRSVSYQPADSGNCVDRCVSQKVFIPSTMHRPTMTFVYSSDFGTISQKNVFVASVTDSISTTRIFTGSDRTVEWTQVWLDMQRWAGQTITIAFGSSNNELTGRIRVDDVSLGSWTTPVVSSAELITINQSSERQLVITGSNFIPTPTVKLNNSITLTSVQWLSENSLHITVPAEVGPGIYDVWVSNPAGENSVLSNALRIGRQHYLPAAIRVSE